MRFLGSLFLVLLVLFGLQAVLRGLGRARWRGRTAGLRARLLGARRLEAATDPPARFDIRTIEGLPAPVRRYFRSVLHDGQPWIGLSRLRHRGQFDMGTTVPTWKPFTSDQLVVAAPPSFDWNATVSLVPGFDVLVHDAYVGGEGILSANLLGLVPVASVRGTPEAAAGELLRYLAEAPWSPTNLLPGRGVEWSPLDDRHARATLVDGATTVSLTFGFDEAGGIESAHVEARPRIVGAAVVPTPWMGRFWSYAERQGMRIPLEAEVAWLTPEGWRPYWRGSIVDADYEFESGEAP